LVCAARVQPPYFKSLVISEPPVQVVWPVDEVIALR
jgi:hypothetical protein